MVNDNACGQLVEDFGVVGHGWERERIRERAAFNFIHLSQCPPRSRIWPLYILQRREHIVGRNSSSSSIAILTFSFSTSSRWVRSLFVSCKFRRSVRRVSFIPSVI